MTSPEQVSATSAKLVSAARVRPAAKDAFIEWGGKVNEALHGFTAAMKDQPFVNI